jgi:hypothetical protein
MLVFSTQEGDVGNRVPKEACPRRLRANAGLLDKEVVPTN